jgi:hypothetical protein
MADMRGHLTCRVDNTLWCGHIEQVIKEHQDADAIQSVHGGSQFVSVPLVPSQGVYAMVWLDRQEREHWLAKAYLQSPTKALPDRTATGDDMFIGFLSAGEGRAILRRMIIQEFSKDMYPEMLVTCESLYHSVNRRLYMVEKVKASLLDQLLEAWSMQWYKRCSLCFVEEQSNPPKWDDSLIPDAPVPRFPTAPPRPRFKA